MALAVSTPKWTGPAFAALGAASGIYLMFAPSLFDYVGQPAEISQRICGPILAVFWIVSAWTLTRSIRWWNLPTALWLLLEPLVLEEPPAASISAVAAALITIAGAFLAHNGDVKETYAGGWIGLWKKDEPAPRN